MGRFKSQYGINNISTVSRAELIDNLQPPFRMPGDGEPLTITEILPKAIASRLVNLREASNQRKPTSQLTTKDWEGISNDTTVFYF